MLPNKTNTYKIYSYSYFDWLLVHIFCNCNFCADYKVVSFNSVCLKLFWDSLYTRWRWRVLVDVFPRGWSLSISNPLIIQFSFFFACRCSVEPASARQPWRKLISDARRRQLSRNSRIVVRSPILRVCVIHLCQSVPAPQRVAKRVVECVSAAGQDQLLRVLKTQEKTGRVGKSIKGEWQWQRKVV